MNELLELGISEFLLIELNIAVFKFVGEVRWPKQDDTPGKEKKKTNRLIRKQSNVQQNTSMPLIN